RIVKKRGLFVISIFHCRDTTPFLKPIAYKTDEINAPCVWCIQQRIVFTDCTVCEQRRKLAGFSLKKIVPYYHYRYTAWRDIFLSTGINKRILFEINGS